MTQASRCGKRKCQSEPLDDKVTSTTSKKRRKKKKHTTSDDFYDVNYLSRSNSSLQCSSEKLRGISNNIRRIGQQGNQTPKRGLSHSPKRCSPPSPVWGSKVRRAHKGRRASWTEVTVKGRGSPLGHGSLGHRGSPLGKRSPGQRSSLRRGCPRQRSSSLGRRSPGQRNSLLRQGSLGQRSSSLGRGNLEQRISPLGRGSPGQRSSSLGRGSPGQRSSPMSAVNPTSSASVGESGSPRVGVSPCLSGGSSRKRSHMGKKCLNSERGSQTRVKISSASAQSSPVAGPSVLRTHSSPALSSNASVLTSSAVKRRPIVSGRTPGPPNIKALENMTHMIFVDFDNWMGFWKRLLKPLPPLFFVWGFFGGNGVWKTPYL